MGAGAEINVDPTGASAAQDVSIAAVNGTQMFGVGVNLDGGAFVAIAGGVNLGIERNDTTTMIAAGADVRAVRDVDVLALSSKKVNSFVGGLSASVGLALNGSAAIYSLGGVLQTDSFNILTTVTGAATVQAYLDQVTAALADGASGVIAKVLDGYAGAVGSQTQAAAGTIAAATPMGSVTAAAGRRTRLKAATATVDGASISAGRDIHVSGSETLDISLDTSFTFAFSYVGLNLNLDAAIVDTAAGGKGSAIDGAILHAGNDVFVTGTVETTQSDVSTLAKAHTADVSGAAVEGSTLQAGNDVHVDARTNATTMYKTSFLPGFDPIHARVRSTTRPTRPMRTSPADRRSLQPRAPASRPKMTARSRRSIWLIPCKGRSPSEHRFHKTCSRTRSRRRSMLPA